MTEPTPAGLSAAELDAASGEQLPDREQMSLVNANVAAPVNVAAALNVLSDGSVAVADATQTADIDQSNSPTPEGGSRRTAPAPPVVPPGVPAPTGGGGRA